MIVDCAAYVHGSRATGRLDVGEIPAWLGKDDAFVWIGLRVPTHEELAAVFAVMGVDELGVEEALSPHERPVLTVDDDLTTLVLRTAHYNETLEQVMLGELSVLLGPHFVITVRHGQASPLTSVRGELEHDAERMALGPDAVLAAIVNQVIEDYGPTLDGIEHDVVEVESQVFDETRAQPVRRLYHLKRQVRELLVATDALHDPLARLARTNRGCWDEEIDAEMQEAADQLSRVVARTRSLSDLLASALDANLTQVSLRQNEDMRKISAWVAIAAVPTMIAGIYGMNFENLPELRWDFGYPMVLGLMAVCCGLLYRNFRKSGWL
jgi:magnesium transporter